LAGAGGGVQVFEWGVGSALFAHFEVFTAANTVGVFARLDVSSFWVDSEARWDICRSVAAASDDI
jgi:hypothetical protein